VAWFTVAAVGVGFVLQNPYAFLAGFISITYLGLEAVRFRRFITAVTDRLDVKVAPTHLSGFVADNFRLDVVIANSYKLPVRIIGSRPRVASQLRVEAGEKKEYLLPSGSEFHTGV